ncbi:MAG TPA: sensor domain-containing diguanylate cyclase [Oculatellaceae cyanobacterium]
MQLESGVPVSQLALAKALKSLSDPQQKAAFQTLLKMEQTPSTPSVGGSWALKEVACAREFNFELPDDLVSSVERLEQAIQNVLGVQQSAILIFDENTGVYSCLNDIKVPGAKPRELTRVSDHFLNELIDAQNGLIHTYLMLDDTLIGMVAVADKQDGTPFTPQDQMLLELAAPYLAVKVKRFQNLKQSLIVPYIQSVTLEVANQLITAVDHDAIITALLEMFSVRLGFDACQYTSLNPDTGLGEILFEVKNSGGKLGKIHSYSHAGLEGKRRTLPDYANLLSLLSSMAPSRFYLHLGCSKLGDRTLSEVFGLKNIQSALLLPIVDSTTGEIRGIFNLFNTTGAAISEESCHIAQEAVQLASRALCRAMVLEKALAMASSDELTGLINRRGYYQRFESELERARRHQTPLCVALVDVDHFKRFNDTYGHLSGDLILKALAELFTKNVRRSDVVCRFGGEEFAILLPDTSLKAAADLMERIRQSVEQMELRGVNGEPLRVTISSGLALVDTRPRQGAHRSEISESLAAADEQLYIAKEKGRNQVCYALPEKA